MFAPCQQATVEINQRDHSIIACHAYIFLFFTHIPVVANHTINATPPERLQQCELHYILYILAKLVFMIVLAPNPKTMKFENPDPET